MDWDDSIHTTTATSSSSGEDYNKLKALERQLEFISIQEEYLKDEMRNLNRYVNVSEHLLD